VYTHALYSFDGDDGDTSGAGYADESVGGSTHNLTANGNAQIDTAQSKFGGSSLYLPQGGTSDYVSAADSDDWIQGDKDWAIDCWVRFEDNSAGQVIVGQWEDSDNYWHWDLDSGPSLRFVARSGGTLQARYYVNWTPVLNTWYHLAVMRDGASLYMYIDGAYQTLTEVVAISTNSMPNVAGPLEIGRRGDDMLYLDAWIDEFRYTDKQLPINRSTDPLYIASGTPSDGFTPPDSPYGREHYDYYSSSSSSNSSSSSSSLESSSSSTESSSSSSP
jgi:hypothetical protein